MKLETILAQKGPKIINRWRKLILETYPADAQRFLKTQKDHFANPVGTTLSSELENVYKELLKGIDPERLSLILDKMIRIRAVQDFTPSQAVSFIVRLKDVVREEAGKEIREQQLFEELMLFESRLDEAVLLAFDIYLMCKEKIYEIKANESRNQVARLLQKAGLTCELPSWKREPAEDNSTPS